MSELSNKISYIKGLAEGAKLSEASEEGKLIIKLIEVLENVSDELENVKSENEDLKEKIDDLEDLCVSLDGDIEELYAMGDIDFDSEDDDEYFDEYDDDDDDLFDAYDDEDGLFEIMCPECGEDVIVDFDMLDDENNIVCPNCHKDIELDFDVDDEEDEEDIND